MKSLFNLLFFSTILISCNSESIKNQDSSDITTDEAKKETLVSDNTSTDSSKTESSDTEISEPINVGDSNFNQLVLKSDKLIIVDFWADWCGPCRMIAPVLKNIAKEYKGKVIVAKVDVDKNQAVSARYNIQNLPTTMFFKNGQPVDQLVGALPKEVFVNKVNQHLVK
jgi:thioredoxin 1